MRCLAEASIRQEARDRIARIVDANVAARGDEKEWKKHLARLEAMARGKTAAKKARARETGRVSLAEQARRAKAGKE